MADTIVVKIKCTSEECEQLRETGLFFETIADALCISRDDIEEIEEDKLRRRPTRKSARF